MAYGNTSVSALLNQAKAALKKQQALEEQVAAYEYDLSPKDQASWQKYNDFLGNRVKQVQASDPAKALSLQRLQTGANRTFTSSEIQRQSIGILEGGGSKQQKLNTMINLYRKAIENGDENLAQRLQLQADTLQQTIMNEAAAGAGRGGGKGTGDTTDAGRGINKALDEFKLARTSLEAKYRRGEIGDQEYIDKMSKIFDGSNNVLKNAFTIAENGDVLPNGNGISLKEAENFYKSRESLRNDNQFQQLMGTDERVPFDIRRAQINGAFKPKFDPLTGETKFEPNNITGIRRLTEFGATQGAFNTTDNVDSKKYSEAFKALGLSGGESGHVNKTYQDYAGNSIEGQFYVNDPNNPQYAYTQDKNNVRYALNKDGQAIMLGDSIAADKQLQSLQARLNNPNISQQEREAIQNDIRNVNTDYLPPDLTQGIQADQQKKADEEYFGLSGVGRKLSSAAGELAGYIPGATSATNVLNKAKLGGLVSNYGKLLAAPMTGAALALGTGAQGFIGGIADLTKRIGVLQEQKKQKDAAEAAQRAAEYQANQQAIAAANASRAAYDAKVAAQNRQSVALPYKATPAGQAAANVIGSSTFNDKYLGTFGGNSLYNKYLR